MDYGVVVLRSSNIRNGRLDLSNPSFTDENHYDERSKRARIQAGDLVITREAPMGEVCLIPDNLRCCLGQRMVMLRPDSSKCHGKYLLYALQSKRVQNQIKSHEGTGSTVSNLRIPVLKELAIPSPSIEKQKAIAHILGTLDDKIELNRKTNETLEAMAKALFKSWFVDFDPVRAKAEGRPTGLPAEISDLFPDSFEDSELGEIPSGWRVHPLSDIFSIQGGSQPPAKTFVDFPGNGYVRLLQIRDFLGDNHLTFVPESKNLRIVGEDDVLIGRYGSGSGKFMEDSLGRPLRGLSGAINVAVVNTLPRQKNMIELIYCMVLSGWFYRQIVGGSSRAVQAGFRKEDLDLIPFPTPPNSILDAFQEIGSKFWHRTKALDIQAKSLCQIRDALLPKLISGEIRIPDAEKLLEEVGV
jgi:type I restriction enzyme S subunit